MSALWSAPLKQLMSWTSCLRLPKADLFPLSCFFYDRPWHRRFLAVRQGPLSSSLQQGNSVTYIHIIKVCMIIGRLPCLSAQKVRQLGPEFEFWVMHHELTAVERIRSSKIKAFFTRNTVLFGSRSVRLLWSSCRVLHLKIPRLA